MTKELLNKFIYLLLDNTMPLPEAIIYHEIKDEGFNSEIFANELSRLELIDTGYGSAGVTYSLKLPVREIINNLSGKYKDDPYTYFFEAVQKQSQTNNEKLNLEIEKLRKELKNYRLFKIITIVSFIISFVLGLKEIINLF